MSCLTAIVGRLQANYHVEVGNATGEASSQAHESVLVGSNTGQEGIDSHRTENSQIPKSLVTSSEQDPQTGEETTQETYLQCPTVSR